MMRRMDDLLQGFVAQHRMKLPGGTCVYSLLRNLFLIANLSSRVTAHAAVIRFSLLPY
ncbi:decarboxylase [Raoultella ornithinolytica]|nr:decarboxylase [Raoultella ornithinolytica]